MALDDPSAHVRTSLRGWLIWGTAALFYLYEFFVRVAPSSMASQLQQHFGLSAAALGAAAGTYYLVYSPMQLISGTLIDRFGPKMVLAISALICSAGAFIEIAGSAPELLAAARFCQGFGSAFAFVGTMFLAAEWFPASRLALLSGLTTSLGMAGGIIGNSGIARIVRNLGWQPALLVAGFVGLAITALILIVVPVHARFAPAKDDVERRPGIIASLRIVYANPQSWYLGIVGASLYMPLSILGALWGVDYMSAVTGAGPVRTAGAISMLYVGWMFGGPLAGYVSDRLQLRRTLLVGASAATLVVTTVVALIPSLSLAAAYGLMLLLGFASTSEVVCFAAAVEHNPARVKGTAIAATNMIIMLLGGIGEWAFGFFLDMAAPASAGKGHYPVDAYHHAILLLPAISAIGLGAAVMITEAQKRRAAQGETPAPDAAVVV